MFIFSKRSSKKIGFSSHTKYVFGFENSKLLTRDKICEESVL